MSPLVKACNSFPLDLNSWGINKSTLRGVFKFWFYINSGAEKIARIIISKFKKEYSVKFCY